MRIGYLELPRFGWGTVVVLLFFGLMVVTTIYNLSAWSDCRSQNGSYVRAMDWDGYVCIGADDE